MVAGLASWRARVLGLLALVMLPRCVEQPESRTLELGIDVRLNGVALRYHEADLGVMAVGEGGTVAWRVTSRAGAELAHRAGAGAVPVWGLVSAVAMPDGSFVIFR